MGRRIKSLQHTLILQTDEATTAAHDVIQHVDAQEGAIAAA